MSHLDNANTLLYGLPDSTINKMQSPEHVHKIITKKTKTIQPNTVPTPVTLATDQISDKLQNISAYMTCKCLNGKAPQYV